MAININAYKSGATIIKGDGKYIEIPPISVLWQKPMRDELH